MAVCRVRENHQAEEQQVKALQPEGVRLRDTKRTQAANHCSLIPSQDPLREPAAPSEA